MKNFAVIENNIVTNIIVCDDITTAQEITKKNCIEYTDENPAYLNGEYKNGVFIAPKPYAGWILDSNNFWQPPVVCPADIEGKYWQWDEETLGWISIAKPQI